MQRDKVFVFGSGGVLVHGCWLNRCVELTQIKPPTGYVGRVKEGDLTQAEPLFSIKLCKEDDEKLMRALREELKVMKGACVIKLDDFTFDFSNYNEESVSILKNAISVALRGFSQLALAC